MTLKDVAYLVKKIVQARIFPDNNKKMNFNIKNVPGEILVVSQFTLYGSLKKGNRPSFMKSAPRHIAEPLYNHFISILKEYNIKIETGKFGALMEINLINDGPVTLIIDSFNG